MPSSFGQAQPTQKFIKMCSLLQKPGTVFQIQNLKYGIWNSKYYAINKGTISIIGMVSHMVNGFLIKTLYKYITNLILIVSDIGEFFSTFISPKVKVTR